MTSQVSVPGQAPPPASDGSWCVVGEADSVEARFGVRDCGPAQAGNQCTFLAPPWAVDSAGHVRAGTLMVLADHILGELSYLRRPSGTWSLTTELTLDLIVDIDAHQLLQARATEVASASDSSFAQCRLSDSSGRILGLGTTRTVYVPEVGDGPLGHADVKSTTEWIPATTIEQALGLTYPKSENGTAEVRLAEPGHWGNNFGIQHGGVASCVAEVAASRLFAQRNPQLRTAQIHTSYLRQVSPGTPYVATARTYHAGRGFAVAEVLGRSGDQLCTVSTVTARRAAHNVSERKGPTL